MLSEQKIKALYSAALWFVLRNIIEFHNEIDYKSNIIYLFVQRVSCRDIYLCILSNGSGRYFVINAIRHDHFARDDGPPSVLTSLRSLGLEQPSGQARKSGTPWKRVVKPSRRSQSLRRLSSNCANETNSIRPTWGRVPTFTGRVQCCQLAFSRLNYCGADPWALAAIGVFF